MYLASIDEPTNTITFPPPPSFLPEVQVFFSPLYATILPYYKIYLYHVLRQSFGVFYKKLLPDSRLGWINLLDDFLPGKAACK